MHISKISGAATPKTLRAYAAVAPSVGKVTCFNFAISKMMNLFFEQLSKGTLFYPSR